MTRPAGAKAAALGLAACYLLNDGEELFTYRASSAWLLHRAPEWMPLPEGARREGWSQAHVSLAIALIGIHWVGASVAGYRSGGRSAWFQNAAAAWGLHGFAHLAACAARGGYVSGALTAPLVIGYGAWARGALRAQGVPSRVSPAGVAASLPILFAAHAGAEFALAAIGSDRPAPSLLFARR
ncbi:HXXEE domain-containing protein [Actinomyces succiniciruminis]|uniref:Integral membrane protein n=1 Tax=Actinomyces succiniciruminis TaxID=1522002 RepID=A0A1L7RQW2_9ACTO|nr:HXXEE domain-containing protein [Actinomyces succiniciruminis]CED92082.1 Integral membrane protein [Actinomyces succiniciruminis]